MTTEDRLLTDIEGHLRNLNPVQAVAFFKRIAQRFDAAYKGHAKATVRNLGVRLIDRLLRDL